MIQKMSMVTIIFNLLLLNAIYTFNIPQVDHTLCTKSTCHLPMEKSLRFFLIGDWGGLPVPPHSTRAQKHVAQAMSEIGANEQTHFQLSLGDNIYTLGATSVNDSRFYTTFEKVYSKGEALFKPWYIMAGNHDYYGDIQAQLDYTYISNRWVFPDFNYTVKYHLADGTRIDIIIIDTVILCGNTKEGKFHSFLGYFGAEKDDRMTQGPQNKTRAEEQWQWLEMELAKSTADYLFVAGHYPMYSTGEHGSTPCLKEHLRDSLHKYKVSAYFSGHDHRVEHLEETFNNWTVHYVLSGAGALEMACDKQDELGPGVISHYAYPSEKGFISMAAIIGWAEGAFVYAEVEKDQATFHYIRGNKEKKHEFTISPRPPSVSEDFTPFAST